jgi:hypothetical protein
MKELQRGLLSAIIVMSSCAVAMAQAPAGQKGAAPPRLVLSVTSTAWPDGGEVPMRNAGRGENKSPAFEFHWNLGTNPGAAPESLQTYAVIFHDVENSTNKTTADTLHWSAFNIPGSYCPCRLTRKGCSMRIAILDDIYVDRPSITWSRHRPVVRRVETLQPQAARDVISSIASHPF